MKQNRMALVPVTAELLSEMDAIEVMGGNVDLPVTTYAKTEECTIYSKMHNELRLQHILQRR